MYRNVRKISFLPPSLGHLWYRFVWWPKGWCHHLVPRIVPDLKLQCLPVSSDTTVDVHPLYLYQGCIFCLSAPLWMFQPLSLSAMYSGWNFWDSSSHLNVHRWNPQEGLFCIAAIEHKYRNMLQHEITVVSFLTFPLSPLTIAWNSNLF